MNRSLLITIHLYLSSFLAAAVLLVAFSGGLYLIGIKGHVEQTEIARLDGGAQLAADPSKKMLSATLASAGIEDFNFGYVKASGDTFYTRPTSETHYILAVSGDEVVITRADPNLQARMIELHKGHGPTAFKTFQKVFALGLVLVILSGLWLGLSSTRLRRKTALAGGAGLLLFVVLLMS